MHNKIMASRANPLSGRGDRPVAGWSPLQFVDSDQEIDMHTELTLFLPNPAKRSRERERESCLKLTGEMVAAPAWAGAEKCTF